MEGSSQNIPGLYLIARALKENRLSHAYLVTGPPGSGKRRFIEECARFLLCRNPVMGTDFARPCMGCTSCVKFERKVNPDFITLEPEGRYIKIDQIRNMEKMLAFSPLESQRRVCAIVLAERMNIDASNALLKTLEEPPENTHLLLGAISASRLLPTIVSRCQVLPVKTTLGRDSMLGHSFSVSVPESDLPFLEYISGGSVQAAEDMLKHGILEIRQAIFDFLFSSKKKELFSPVSLSISGSRDQAIMAISIFNAITRDLILLARAPHLPENRLVNRDRAQDLADLAQKINCDSLFDFRYLVEKAERYLERNVNPEMISDMLLIFWLKSDRG